MVQLTSMIIYKITNIINNKIYIGQTVKSLNERWSGHKYSAKTESFDSILYKAMRKYGVENFKIEEIDGANSIAELNYKEWLLIQNLNTLAPNGYNLMQGGNNGLHHDETKRKMSKNSGRKKAVINIETNEIYKSASECARKNNLNTTTLSEKLNGKYTNNTPFRYIGMEGIQKELRNSKKVININDGTIYDSCTECAISNGINPTTLSQKLLGKTGNDTPFRYVGMENIYKKPAAVKQVINIETGEFYNSCTECARKNGLKTSSLSQKLLGKKGNDTPFRYVGMENIYKKPGVGAPKKVINTVTGETYRSASECARKNNIKKSTLEGRLNGNNKNNTDFKYLEA
jgi:group I intron endonuclease